MPRRPNGMNVLIVYAHPDPASLNAALKDQAVDVLAGAGHKVEVSDLYATGFNPVAQTGNSAAAVEAEVDKLARADLLIFQFPLWWSSLPAMLKGWVDRVFAAALSQGKLRGNGTFPAKRAMLSFTTGGRADSFGSNERHGDIDEMMRHVHHGMFHYIGMEVLPPFIVYGASRCAAEELTAYLSAYRERLLSLDQTSPILFTRAA